MEYYFYIIMEQIFNTQIIRLINQKRITEDTFEDLEALNLIHGNIKQFYITRIDLKDCRMKYIYDKRTKVNQIFNNDYIVEYLSKYNDFRSIIIKNGIIV